MERVREQHEPRRELWVIRREEARLPPAVRVAAEEGAPGDELPDGEKGAPQALAVARGHARQRGPARPRLAEGQVAAQDREAGAGERARERDQERRPAVSAGPVGEDDAVTRRPRRTVQDTAHGWPPCRRRLVWLSAPRHPAPRAPARGPAAVQCSAWSRLGPPPPLPGALGSPPPARVGEQQEVRP